MTIVIDGTTGISGVDGTAANPAIKGNDSNTGISYGTDTVTINTGGVARVTTNASGNVGIGTASPIVKLQVVQSTDGEIGRYQRTGGTNIPILRFNLTESPSVAEIEHSGAAVGSLAFKTDGTERMRIDSSGNLLVGTTTFFPGAGNTNVGFMYENAGTFFVSRASGVAANFNRNTDGTNLAFRRSGTEVGSISVTASATAYNTSSDYRLKENVVPMTGALCKVAQLKPCTYNWKADGSAGQGFIAHELQEVVPDCVTGEKDAVSSDGEPIYQGVDTSFLVATLVAAIQEQQTLIQSLTSRLEALENK